MDTQTKNASTEFFKGVLRDCGIKLSSNEDPNYFTQEQALIVRDIEKMLEDADDSVTKFMKGFKVLVKKEKYLKKAMMPSQLRNDTSDSDDVFQQDSLFR